MFKSLQYVNYYSQQTYPFQCSINVWKSSETHILMQNSCFPSLPYPISPKLDPLKPFAWLATIDKIVVLTGKVTNASQLATFFVESFQGETLHAVWT